MIKKILATICVIAIGFNTISYAGFIKAQNSNYVYYIENDELITNQWRQVDNKYYYFGEDGKMLRNTVTPDGYKVDEDGVFYEYKLGWYKRKAKNAEGKLYIRQSANMSDSIIGEWGINEGKYISYIDGTYAQIMENGQIFGYVPYSEIEYDEGYNFMVKQMKNITQ